MSGGFDEQLRRAWKGDYSVAPPPARGAPPPAWGAPELAAAPAKAELRLRLRREMESIAEAEAVTISEPPAHGEGRGGQEAPMKLAKFVKFREEKFGGVLFETRNEKVYTLNPTGAAVVRLVVAGASDVVAGLKDRYEDEGGALEAEARAFLEDLKAKGLVEA